MSNKDDIITISNEQIIQLRAGARGYRQAFYVLYDSIMKQNDGSTKFNDIDVDVMSVLGTVGCFSVELYLKFLSVILSFNDSKKEGVHIKCHSLDKLFNDIAIHYPQKVDEILSDIHNWYDKKTFNLVEFLSSIKDGFIDWRYAYSSGVLNCNLNDLSFVMNALETVSNELFIPVSRILSSINLNKKIQQYMTFDNLDSIKCDIFTKFYEDD